MFSMWSLAYCQLLAFSFATQPLCPGREAEPRPATQALFPSIFPKNIEFSSKFLIFMIDTLYSVHKGVWQFNSPYSVTGYVRAFDSLDIFREILDAAPFFFATQPLYPGREAEPSPATPRSSGSFEGGRVLLFRGLPFRFLQLLAFRRFFALGTSTLDNGS